MTKNLYILLPYNFFLSLKVEYHIFFIEYLFTNLNFLENLKFFSKINNK